MRWLDIEPHDEIETMQELTGIGLTADEAEAVMSSARRGPGKPRSPLGVSHVCVMWDADEGYRINVI